MKLNWRINWKAIPDALKLLGQMGEKHLPTILTCGGTAGFIGTAFLVADEAPRAQTAIRKAELEKSEREHPGELDLPKVKLTPWETVKVVSGYYWPAFALGTASTICVLGAHKIDLTRLASVTAAYQLSKKDIKELKEKIIEKDGPEKLKEYEKEVHEPTVQRVFSEYGPTDIYTTGKGTTIFFDPTIGMPFYCDLFTVEKAIRHMVQGCKDEDSYPLSAFRHEIGLPRNDNEDDYRFYYEFVRDTIRNVDNFDFSDYFEYHSLNPEDGDNRACIWITVSDFLSNRNGSDDEGVPFRFR